MSALSRRPGESAADHVYRLLDDDLFTDATDVEIAEVVRCRADFVREVRERVDGVAYARQVARSLVRPEGETLGQFIRAAVTHYALASCAEGLCSHPTCHRDEKSRAA